MGSEIRDGKESYPSGEGYILLLSLNKFQEIFICKQGIWNISKAKHG